MAPNHHVGSFARIDWAGRRITPITLGECVMPLIEAGNGEIRDGPRYNWQLEDADGPGCHLTVAIGEWKLTRPYPTMLTSAEATTEAEKLAPTLLISINNAN